MTTTRKPAVAGQFYPADKRKLQQEVQELFIETGWSHKEFPGHCARDKAVLDWDEWKLANISIFTATVF
ncbi:MAG: hypothetical protein QM800_13375 [Paludibacter sp.]